MKNPEQVKARRKILEQELEELDNIEQTWAELSRGQRIAELIHGIGCTKQHGDFNDYCKFHLGKWEAPNWWQDRWLSKAVRVLEILPEDMSDDKVVETYRVVKDA